MDQVSTPYGALADGRARSETYCLLLGQMQAHREVIKRGTLEGHQPREDGVSSRLKSVTITPKDCVKLINQAQRPISGWIREEGKSRAYHSSPCTEEDHRGRVQG
jgi:hypothetical protein